MHPEPVTAIDIALDPDAMMIGRAEAANARLRQLNPGGYALDATHRPHVTTLQRFVRTADFDKICGAASALLGSEKPATWVLQAYKYGYVVWDGEALTNILIEPTQDLIRFQQRLIETVAPFFIATGTASAFFTTPEQPDINQPTIDYVARYVPDSSGGKLNPHVTVGVAPPAAVEGMVAEPFAGFAFSPVALSVYHLGNFGTARQALKTWRLAL